MNTLIQNIRTWGITRGITGVGGKASPMSQHSKTLEEVQELTDALTLNDRPEIADAIGDIVVTLILQADLQGMDFQECVQGAYEVINKRTGKMVDGVFCKDPEPAPSIEDDLGELEPAKACKLGDETCESCQ